MKLSDIEKAILHGERGRASQQAMELIVRYAGVLGAEQLCRVTWGGLVLRRPPLSGCGRVR